MCDRRFSVQTLFAHTLARALLFVLTQAIISALRANKKSDPPNASMEREDRHGIAHLIFSGKDQVALIRSLQGLLQMAMLSYDAESGVESLTYFQSFRPLDWPEVAAIEARRTTRLLK